MADRAPQPHSPAPDGDPSLAEWVDALRGPLVGLVASWSSSWREAEEIAQDALAEAWMARERFEGDWRDPKAIGPWVRGIAFRLNASRRRKRARLRRLADVDEGDEPVAPTFDEDRRLEAMRRAFEQLEVGYQEILRMRYLDRTTAKRVAELLGITPKAVERRVARARLDLRARTEQILVREAVR